MVYIAYFTELNSKIWDYAQKRRICRENCKYALDKNFHCHFCPRRKAVKFCHPEIKWNWWCKIFGLKIRRCRILDKFHVGCFQFQNYLFSTKLSIAEFFEINGLLVFFRNSKYFLFYILSSVKFWVSIDKDVLSTENVDHGNRLCQVCIWYLTASGAWDRGLYNFQNSSYL